MTKYRGNGYGWVKFSNSITPQGFWGAKHIRPKHFELPNCPIGPTLQEYRFILCAILQSIMETAMAGSNSYGFWGCHTQTAKAFSASKLPHRPHTAKIQVYSPRPMAKYRVNGYGWAQFSRSIPPQGFWGAKHIRPKHSQLPNCLIGPTLKKYRFILCAPRQV